MSWIKFSCISPFFLISLSSSSMKTFPKLCPLFLNGFIGASLVLLDNLIELSICWNSNFDLFFVRPSLRSASKASLFLLMKLHRFEPWVFIQIPLGSVKFSLDERRVLWHILLRDLHQMFSYFIILKRLLFLITPKYLNLEIHLKIVKQWFAKSCINL